VLESQVRKDIYDLQELKDYFDHKEPV